LNDNYQELIDQAAEGGVTYLVCANTPIGTLGEIKASIETLNKASVAAKKAGKDPVEMFKANKGRFHLWHVKDLDKNREKVIEVGKGDFDFKRIFEHASDAGMKYFFIEQDGAPSPIENITTSYNYIHKLLHP
jgi:hypothetical protein